MHTGKTSSAISFKRRQAVKVISDTGMHLNFCEQSLSFPVHSRMAVSDFKLYQTQMYACVGVWCLSAGLMQV